MASAADTFAPLIRDVAVKLLGDPDKDSNGKILRWGSRGSFKVDVPDGTWYSHEEKKGGGTLDLVMRERSCDKGGALEWLEAEGLIEPREGESTFYDYRDERGAVLYRVERRPHGAESRFWQHGPDGQGGFVCRKGCMQGVRRVLYHLDKLAAADRREIVFYTEGEKDCDRLINAGLVATTNPQGAGEYGSVKSCIAQHLAGRRVVILEDNDVAGANHVATGIAAMRNVAAVVVGLKLDGLPTKGDVSDWLNAGGTIAKLRELAEATIATGTPPPPDSDHGKANGTAAHKPAYLNGISAAALMAMQFEPIRYIVNGYIAEGLTVLAGAPKIGKSWMALNIAIAVASGRPAFGSIPCDAGDVLYLALEDNRRRLKSRMLKMAVREAPERLTFCTAWPSLGDGAVREVETWALAAERPVLVIVDVLTKVRDAANGRDSAYEGDYRALTGLQELAGRAGLAIVLVHHTRKMDADDPFDSVSGTRGLTGAADTVLVLKRDSGTARCTLYGRGRDIEEIETACEFNRDSGTWRIIGAAHEVARTDERQIILDTLRKSPNPLSAREISDLICKPYENVRRTVTRMVQSEEIERKGQGQYTCPTCPTVPPEHEPLPSGTGGTAGTALQDDEGWIGESPAQTAIRLARGGR